MVATGTMGIGFWVIYLAAIFGLMYFIAIRPQKKEKKKMQELMASIAVGDTVLTSSGFYGVIIDDRRYRYRRVWQQQELPYPDAEAGNYPDRKAGSLNYGKFLNRLYMAAAK